MKKSNREKPAEELPNGPKACFQTALEPKVVPQLPRMAFSVAETAEILGLIGKDHSSPQSPEV